MDNSIFHATPDDCPPEPLLFYLALFSDGPLHAERKAVFVWVEGAQVLAEPPRQHGHHSLYQVHRGGARASRYVQIRSFLHEVGNVRNVHTDAVATTAEVLHGQSIVLECNMFMNLLLLHAEKPSGPRMVRVVVVGGGTSLPEHNITFYLYYVYAAS